MRGQETRVLGAFGLWWRLAVTAVVVTMVGLGTWVGDDGWWPFAPMSQYAFAVRNDGVVSSLGIDALTVDGDLVRVPLSKERLGIERAEIEGQAPRIVRQPELLQDLAVLHSRRLPHEPAYAVLYVRTTTTRIVTGFTTVTTLATWTVRSPEHPQPSTVSEHVR